MAMEDMFDDQLLMNMIPAENFSSSAAVCAPASAQWPHGYFPPCTDYYTNSLVCIISKQSHALFKFGLYKEEKGFIFLLWKKKSI